MKSIRCILVLALLLFSNCITAQVITGCVNDAKTKESLPNVNVYLAGTSIGTVTNMDGCFTINYRPELKTALVLSAIGYDVLTVENPLTYDFSGIELVPKIDDLEPVLINPDPWSRIEKEKWFKRILLGTIPAASDCEILNLKAVRLRFNPVTNMLSAVCDEPIIIINKYTGYKIAYDLNEFEGNFTPLSNGKVTVTTIKASSTQAQAINASLNYRYLSSYIAGSPFFSELAGNKPSERRRRTRREDVYEQSSVRLYRSLMKETLKEDGYLLYYKGFATDVKSHVRVKPLIDGFVVEFRQSSYAITDSKKAQSDITLNEQRIVLDLYGNLLTPRAILFSGYIGKTGMSGMLPMEYGLDPIKQ